jgi:hypothetical protein
MHFSLKKENKPIPKDELPKPVYQEFLIHKEEEDVSWPHVVNIKSKEKFDVYIGRSNTPNAPIGFGNPFIIGKDGNRDEVIEKYENYLLNNPELMEKIQKELKGKVLGCFCHPLKCHGDIILKYANPEFFLNNDVKNTRLNKR